MTRDEFNRCAVCGRRESEVCCADCHRGHDYAWENPEWSVGFSQVGSGRIVTAKGLANAYKSGELR